MKKLLFSLGLVVALLGATIFTRAWAQNHLKLPSKMPSNAYKISSHAGTFVDISTNSNTVVLNPADLADGTDLKNIFLEPTSETDMTVVQRKTTSMPTKTSTKSEFCFPLGFDFKISGETMRYFYVNALGGAYFSPEPTRTPANCEPSACGFSGNCIHTAIYIPTSSTGSYPTKNPAGFIKKVAGKAPACYLIEGSEGNHVLTIQHDILVNGDEWIFQTKYYEGSNNFEFVVGELKAEHINTPTKPTLYYYSVYFGLYEGYPNAYSEPKSADTLSSSFFNVPSIPMSGQHKWYAGRNCETDPVGGWGAAEPVTSLAAAKGMKVTSEIQPAAGSTVRFTYPSTCNTLSAFQESDYSVAKPTNTETELKVQLAYKKELLETFGPYNVSDVGTIVAVLSDSDTPDFTLENGTFYFKGHQFPETESGFVPTVLANQFPTISSSGNPLGSPYGIGTISPFTVSITGLEKSTCRYIHIYRMSLNCDNSPIYSPLCFTIAREPVLDPPALLETVGMPTINSVKLHVKPATGQSVIILKSKKSINLNPKGVLKKGDKIGTDVEVVDILSAEKTWDVPMTSGEGCYFVAISANTSNPKKYLYSPGNSLWCPARAAYNGLPGLLDMSQETYGYPNKANEGANTNSADWHSKEPNNYRDLPLGWTRDIELADGKKWEAFGLGHPGYSNNVPSALYAVASQSASTKTVTTDVITVPILANKNRVAVTYELQIWEADGSGLVSLANPANNDQFQIQYAIGSGAWQSAASWTGNNLPAADKDNGVRKLTYTLVDDNLTGKYIRFRFYFTGQTRTSTGTYISIKSLEIKEDKLCQTPTNLAQTISQTTTTQFPVTWTDPNPTKAQSYRVTYRRTGATGDWSEKTVTAANVLLSGLRSSTTYAVYVTAVCGVDEESYPTDTTYFTTAYTFPYSEPMAQRDTLIRIQGSDYPAVRYSPFPGKAMPAYIPRSDGGVNTYTGQLPNSGNATLTLAKSDGSNTQAFSHAYTYNKMENVKMDDGNGVVRVQLKAVGVKEQAQYAWVVTPVIFTANLEEGQPLTVRFRARSAYRVGAVSTTNRFTKGSVGSKYSSASLKVLVSNTGNFSNSNLIGTVNVGGQTDIDSTFYEFDVPEGMTGSVQVAFYYANPNYVDPSSQTAIENNNDYMTFEIFDVRFEYKNDVALCPPLEGLERKSLTPHSATYEWAPSDSAKYYDFTYGPAETEESGEDWHTVKLTKAEYTMTGLDVETTYKVKVTGYCDEEGENAAPDPLEDEFTTPEGCATPTLFRVKDVTYYGATFISEQTQEKLFEREVYVSTPNNTFSKLFKQPKDTLVVEKGLYDNTSYTAKTRAICRYGTASVDTSEWSSAVSFATPVDPANLPDTLDVRVVIAPAGAGTVTGARKYVEGEDEEITLTATPSSSNYIFKAWVNTANNDTVGRNATYTRLAKLEEDEQEPNIKTHLFEYKAVFRKVYTITATPYPTGAGTVTGGGTYDAGKEVALTATPKSNYVFVEWKNADDEQVGTNGTYKFTPTADATFTAVFRLKKYYTLDVQVTPNSEWGNVTLSKEPNEDNQYAEGTAVTLTAVPAASYYKFVQWEDATGKVLGTNASYTVSMDNNKTVKAVFAPNRYQVTLKSDPNTTYGTIKGSTGNTTTGGMFDGGTTRRIVAQPKAGYVFVKWMSGTQQLGTDTALSFLLTRDTTITAYFAEKNPLDIKVTVEPAGAGTVTGAGTVVRGGNATLTATPAAHYAFKEWQLANGSTPQDNPYTINNVLRDYTVKAVFRALENCTVTVEKEGQGTVTGAGTYEEGSNATLTATAAAHYYFMEWQDADGNTLQTEATYTFKVTGNTTVKAVFKPLPEYTVTLQRLPSNAAGDVTGAGKYETGTEVTITASPKSGYKFVEWQKNDGTLLTKNASYKFTVTSNVTYRAVFEALCQITVTVDPAGAATVTGAGTYNNGDQVTLTATVDESYIFMEWQDADGFKLSTANPYKFTADESKNIKAVLREKGHFSIDVPCTTDYTEDENDPGSVSFNPTGDDGEWMEGETVTMTATPAQYYTFVGWKDNKGNSLGTNPTYSFVISKDTAFEAVFSRIQYTVTLVSNPDKTYGVINGTSGSQSDGGTYAAGTTRKLEAKPKSGYEFVKWMSGSVELSTNPKYEFVLTQDITITAYFKEKAELDITVTVNPADAGTVTGAGKVTRGNNAVLTATPNSEYKFLYWERVDGTQHEDNPYTLVQPKRDYSFTAQFRAKYQYDVTVTTTEGGSVDKAGLLDNGKALEDATITLTAEASAGYRFTGWEDADGNMIETDETYTFTATANTTLKAVFTEITKYTVTLQRKPSSAAGRVTGGGSYEENTSVTITATANPGYEFVEWQKADGSLLTKDASYTFTPTANVTYTAVFQALVDIAVTVDPAGAGTVTGAGTYAPNEDVTLTATPKSNYVFVEWRNASGNQVSTSTTYTFKSTVSTTYTAVFRLKKYYELNVAVKPNDEWGNVTFDKTPNEDGQYVEGTEVTMTAVPSQYYKFVAWVAGSDTVGRELTYKVTMDGNKNYTAVFAQIRYRVTLVSNPNTDYGTVKGTSGTTTTGGVFVAGSTRKLEAQPKSGYEFVKWMSGDVLLGTDPKYEFVLTQDITITAYFKEKAELDITVNIEPTDAGTVTGAGKVARGSSATLTATPAAHYAFKEWRRVNNTTIKANPYTFTPDRDYTFTAVFRDLETFTVTVEKEGNGTVTGAGAYEEGSEVTLTAAPAAHYEFTEWQDADGNTLGSATTHTFKITGNTTVKAVFTSLPIYTVTLQKMPSNAAGTVTGGGDYEVGTKNVTITATPNKGYRFLYWENKWDGSQISNDVYTIAEITSNVTYTAVFEELVNIKVSVTPTGAGTVKGAGTYDPNEEVTLTATADDDYLFAEWQDADGNILSDENPYVFNATESMDIKAFFREKSYFTIDVSSTSEDGEDDLGSVKFTPNSSEGEWKEGSTVTMTAKPAQYCKFVEWQDKDGNVLGTDPDYSFVISQDTAFTAVFAHIQYTLTLVSNPDKTYGYINGTSGSQSDGGTYNAGTTRKLEAKPRSGYEFVKWMSGTKQLGTNPKLEFVLTRDTTITAYFQEKAELDIKVTVNPANAGTVTGAGKVQRGNDAVLTANPNTEYKFLYWERVDGTQHEDNPYTLVQPKRDYSFTAQFRLREQYTVTTMVAPTNAAGTVTKSGLHENGKALEDATITLTAAPAEGYQFKEWQNASGQQVGTNVTYTFTATANVVYKAVFEEIPTVEYTVTLNRDPVAGGKILGDGTYEENKEATISATANAGYTFAGWYDAADNFVTADNPYKFTVTSDVTYTAKFTEKPMVDVDVTVRLGATVDASVGTVEGAGSYEKGKTVTLKATPASDDYIFSGWRDINNDDELIGSANPLTFTAATNVHYAAVFREKFEVTLNILPDDNAGTVTGAGPGRQGYPRTITATPAEGYIFVGWYDEENNLVTTDASHTFILEDNVTFTAKFEEESEDEYTITLRRLPNNDAGTVKGNGRYALGEEATLVATPAENYLFVAWLKPKAEDPTQYDTVSKRATQKITVEGNATYVALFRARARYMIDVDILPNDNAGTVTGDGEYREGRTVTLTAEPAEGYTFVAWVVVSQTPSPKDTVSRTETYTFTASKNATYKAVFKRTIAKYTLNLNVSPREGGKASGDGIYNANQSVTVTATPNPGYTFVGWRLLNGNIESRNLTYTFKITRDMTITAVFKAIPKYTVSLNVMPREAGTVTGAGTYEEGAPVTITATANEGYTFKEWQDAAGNTVNTEATHTFQATANVEYTAMFTKDDVPVPDKEYTVELNVLPDRNAGRVTGAGTYKEGELVSIAAIANPGYTFVQWQDAFGKMQSTLPTFTFKATADVVYTAVFEANIEPDKEYTVTLNVLPNLNAGTVEGYGIYKGGEMATITATPAPGYTFVAWMNGSDTLRKDASFTFMVVADVTYAALFKEKENTANEQQTEAAFNVGAGNGKLYIENINDVIVKDVTVYNTVGRRLAHFTPNRRGNLTLPVNANSAVLVVRVVSEQGAGVYKVYLH